MNLTSSLRALGLGSLLLGALAAAGCRPYATVCGDRICEGTETATSCAMDCAPICGDDFCVMGETAASCPGDCGPPICGDTTCSRGRGETCSTCAVDCGACPACGDGMCNGAETCMTCLPDCGMCAVCGDSACNGSESCSTCAMDCGTCPIGCGDGLCNGTETCTTCTLDCGACVRCGDSVCSSGETCASCTGDCGSCSGCGDGACTGTETCGTCATDCGTCGVCGNGLCDGFETCSTCSRDCGACSSGAEPYETCMTTADCDTSRDTCVFVANRGVTRGMCTVTMCANDDSCDFDMFSARGDCLTFDGASWDCYHRCLDDGDCYPGWGCYTPTGATGAIGTVCLPEGTAMTVAHYRECTSSAMCIDALQCVNFRVLTASTNLCSRTGCSTDMDCPLDGRGGRGACLSFGGSTAACWERCSVRGDCPNTVDYDCTTSVGGYVSPVPICVPR